MNRWPSARKTSATPENRMNSQAYFSKLGMPLGGAGRAGCPAPPAGRAPSPERVPPGLRGDGVDHWRAHRNRSAMCMPSTPSAGIITASQTRGHHPQHEALIARTVLPEVDQDDPDAVERVVEHRRDQPDLHQPDDRRLVGVDDLVVGLRADPDQRGVEHVHEQEEEDGGAGDAVQHPRPHARVAAIKGAPARRLLLAGPLSRVFVLIGPPTPSVAFGADSKPICSSQSASVLAVRRSLTSKLGLPTSRVEPRDGGFGMHSEPGWR